MSLPEMTPEQRADGLRKAAESRAARSAALARVRSGEVTIADVLDSDDSPLLAVPVRRVLLAVPRVGTARADKILAELGINKKRRIRGLGVQQRAILRDLAERLAA